MIESNIANRIREHWPELTKSDRMVARRLLSEYPVAGLKTLADLAARAGVSAPSVIRCVKKLGFTSYPEFQSALHDEVQASFEHMANDYPEAANREDITDVEVAYAQSVRKTVRLTQDGELDQLATLIARSRASVLCLGGRVSQALAMIFQAHLLRQRRNVELVSTNAVERAERLMDVGKNDVIVLFDYGPYDPQAVSFAKLASEAKASVILFTDFEQSPAAEYAQHVVCADNQATGTAPSLAAAVCSAEIVLNEVRNKIGTRAQTRHRSLASVPDVALDLKLRPKNA